MRPLLARAKVHTPHAKGTSTKSSKDIRSAGSGGKGGPLSPIWSPPPPSCAKKAPYETLDEDLPDLEKADGCFEMGKWPQTLQNARFESNVSPSLDFRQERPFQSILRSERRGKERVPVSLLEPRYIGPARI